MTQAHSKHFTPQEYYDLESLATYRSDYYRGEIFAMAGGTPRHSLICGNLIRELGIILKKTPCAVYESNLRLKNKFTGLRNYPDVSVYCGALEYDEEDSTRQTVVNPTVLFEVLSPSTEAYDRGFKAQGYRRIESLRAYVLVSQDKAHIEIFERDDDGSWSLREAAGLETLLGIPPLGIQLPLAEIYARVDFSAPDSEPTAPRAPHL
ncbi:MAG TPA: Uma2 family endonuclease [Tepidisphaeraceae bacterium]|jgi:Uma2 family endonuclease|nr:Uma2 family endonuclease [Tepidisphaeraceae bacterium]